MGTSPYEWEIREWDDKPKQTNKKFIKRPYQKLELHF